MPTDDRVGGGGGGGRLGRVGIPSDGFKSPDGNERGVGMSLWNVHLPSVSVFPPKLDTGFGAFPTTEAFGEMFRSEALGRDGGGGAGPRGFGGGGGLESLRGATAGGANG